MKRIQIYGASAWIVDVYCCCWFLLGLFGNGSFEKRESCVHWTQFCVRSTAGEKQGRRTKKTAEKARQQRTQQPAKPNPTHRHPSFLQLKTAWIQSLGLPMTEEVRLFRCLGATFCLEMVRTKASIRFMVVVGSWDGINL